MDRTRFVIGWIMLMQLQKFWMLAMSFRALKLTYFFEPLIGEDAKWRCDWIEASCLCLRIWMMLRNLWMLEVSFLSSKLICFFFEPLINLFALKNGSVNKPEI